MIRLPRTLADAAGFLDRVESSIAGVVSTPRPPRLCLVRVDSWFDDKWVQFSGKMLGALGVAAIDVTVPPFHPHRVQGESWWMLGAKAVEYVPDANPHAALHIEQPSERNLRRRMRDLAPGAMCAWYSGDSAVLGRGSLMVYMPSADGTYWCWYVALAAAEARWRTTRLSGISQAEFEALGHGTGPSRAAV